MNTSKVVHKGKFNKKIIVIIAAAILLVFFAILLFGENVNYSKDESMGVWKITDGLYRETYRVYGGGAYGGDVRTVYLTDSLTFRKYIGKISDHERIEFDFIKENKIRAYILNFDNLSPDLKVLPPDTIKVTVYSLSDLRKGGYE